MRDRCPTPRAGSSLLTLALTVMGRQAAAPEEPRTPRPIGRPRRRRGEGIMIRPVGVTLIALVFLGCGKEAGDVASVPAASQPRPTDASFEFEGESSELAVLGDCGPAADGSFKTWAVTLDADGTPLPDGPHLLALSEGNWSVIDFYPGQGEQIIRVYREGADKLRFADGVLEFDGALGAGLTEKARARIVCPSQASEQADRRSQ